ncbi:hypothetical protein R3I94_016733 [Phoxinus phoxinus]
MFPLFSSSQDNTEAIFTRNQLMGEHMCSSTNLINLVDKREREKWRTKSYNLMIRSRRDYSDKTAFIVAHRTFMSLQSFRRVQDEEATVLFG